jgi:hypothetical protein
MRWIEGNASIHRFYFCHYVCDHFLDGALANFLRVGYTVRPCTTLSREGCMKSVLMRIAFPARPLH